jgi:hypothetical protein
MPLNDMVTRLNANHNVRTRDVVTIVSGHETGVHTRRIRIAANGTTAQLQSRPPGAAMGSPWADIVGATVTRPQMVAFVNFLENNSYAAGHHRNVLNNAVWRVFYNYAARPLAYIDNANVAVVKPHEASLPCFDCELVLPVRNIQIDHQRPQAGNPVEPVCKVFRSLGLTLEAATGPKGLHFGGVHMASVGGVAGIAGAAPGSPGKYTLSDRGQIYFTIADWCGLVDPPSELDEACMNHVINLRPLCSNCNPANRNTRHF